MVQRRPIANPEPEPSSEPSSSSSGYSIIHRRLLTAGENTDYAREHAARIWNNSHPEHPVKTSFDDWTKQIGKFNPLGNLDLETPKTPENSAPAPHKDIMTSSRPNPAGP